MGTPRKNFSDAVRAAAYARDRATCCYSGKSLWIADFGADPHFAIDWAEHYEPAARGGHQAGTPAISAAIRCAASAGSAAPVIGRPMTR